MTGPLAPFGAAMPCLQSGCAARTGCRARGRQVWRVSNDAEWTRLGAGMPPVLSLAAIG